MRRVYGLLVDWRVLSAAAGAVVADAAATGDRRFIVLGAVAAFVVGARWAFKDMPTIAEFNALRVETETNLAEARRLAGVAVNLPSCCGSEIYWCPRTGQFECPTHGGFNTCCDQPKRHIPLTPLGVLREALMTEGAGDE